MRTMIADEALKVGEESHCSRQEFVSIDHGPLTPHPPGSNGDVRRGPDRYPRVQVAGAMLMKALMKEGALLIFTSSGKRRYRGKVPAAMVENFVTRLTRIVSHGTDANVLRLLATTNEVFRPLRNGKNGSHGHPTPSTFIRPPQEPQPEGGVPPASSPGALLDANGQEYVPV